jgi:hypothetical protein
MVAYFPGITAAGTLAPGLAAATVRNTLGLGAANSPTFAGLTVGDGVTHHGTLVVKNNGDDLLTVDNVMDGRLQLKATGPHGQEVAIFARALGGGAWFTGESPMALGNANGGIYLSGSTTSGATIRVIDAALTSRILNITPGNPANVGLNVQGLASQSGSLQEWRDSSGVAMLGVSASGAIFNAANIIEQRNGTSGQVNRLYKTYTSATNGEWLENDALNNATTFDIATSIGSTGGSTRGLRFGTKSGAGAFTSWQSFDTSGNATFSGQVLASASTTTRASLNVPSGTAPTSPVNGDIWSDGSDLLVRLGGTTYTLAKV